MKAHHEPRTDLDSHEAVCLQARSVRPLSITHDAVIHGAMSDATLSARRAGRSPMASPACARVRSASNSIKSGLGMGHSGGRATPQARGELDISLARVRSREDAHGVAAAGGCRGVGSRSTCLYAVAI